MDKHTAEIIMQLLEFSCAGSLQPVRDLMLDQGYTAKEICAAWKDLEKLAGMVGVAPSEDDIS